VRAVPWADEAEKEPTRLHPSACDLYVDIRIFGVGLRKEPDTLSVLRICWKIEEARQASSPRLCASVRAVPWAHEAEQQLSSVECSACDLCAHVHIFRAELLEATGTDPQNYV